MIYDIFDFFPIKISEILRQNINTENFNYLEEIRIRCNKNVILHFNDKEVILKYKITSNDILEILQSICENSIYTYQKEICEGYITIKGRAQNRCCWKHYN